MKFLIKKFFLLISMVPFISIIGCGGFGASGTVSPAMFLIPGLGKNSSPSTSVSTNGSFVVNSQETVKSYKMNYLSQNFNP